MQTFFILGNHPDLSREELNAYIKVEKPRINTENVLITETEALNTGNLQKKLGGTIKIGTIHAEITDQEELADTLAALATTYRQTEGKLKFGISIYSGGHRGKLSALRTKNEKLGLEVKKRIKVTGKSVRYVSSMTPVLSSVIVRKQKLLQTGIEFCLFPTRTSILVGITETTQDFDEWSARDYGRPARDAIRGMLPPKLARIMLNIADGNPATDTILDPFCGIGTVLTEAMAIGYKHIIGSDKDQEAVEATRTNVAWESARTGITVTPNYYKSKADALATFIAPKSVDRIVAEMYLGKPRTGKEDRIELEQRIEKLVEMYTESFRGFKSVLSEGATVVVAVPAYIVDGFTISVKISQKAKLFGLEQIEFDSESATREGALRYGRKDQWVMRDIYKFIYKEA